jgi:hypothetical protein
VRDAPPRLDLVFRGRAEPDVRSAVALFGGQHAGVILRSVREAEPIDCRSGPDELPEARAPSRGVGGYWRPSAIEAQNTRAAARGLGLPISSEGVPANNAARCDPVAHAEDNRIEILRENWGASGAARHNYATRWSGTHPGRRRTRSLPELPDPSTARRLDETSACLSATSPEAGWRCRPAERGRNGQRVQRPPSGFDHSVFYALLNDHPLRQFAVQPRLSSSNPRDYFATANHIGGLMASFST